MICLVLPACTCRALLNPYCQVDFRSKLWVCPFCAARNYFPPHYAENISKQNLPAELIPQFSSVEYELPSIPNAGPPVFIFVVDACNHEDELKELGDSVTQALNLLPDDALVGFITYGGNVNVFELGFEGVQKSYVFRGTKEYHASGVGAQVLLDDVSLRVFMEHCKYNLVRYVLFLTLFFIIVLNLIRF